MNMMLCAALVERDVKHSMPADTKIRRQCTAIVDKDMMPAIPAARVFEETLLATVNPRTMASNRNLPLY
jgi:hypothetical protein